MLLIDKFETEEIMKKAILAGIFLSYSVIANTTVIEFNNINSYVLKKVDGKQLYKNLKSEVSRTQIVKKITQDGEVTTLNSSQNTTPIFDEDLLSLRFEGDYADGVVQLSTKSEVDFMNDLDKKVETDDALGSLLYRTLIRPFIKYF